MTPAALPMATISNEPAGATGITADRSGTASSSQGKVPGVNEASDKVYLGIIKSYNDRRGFGFVACTDTVNAFGRDVYLPKAEVQSALKEVAHGASKPAPIEEDDLVQFRVRLSVEGFPQAASLKRLRTFRGIVAAVPRLDTQTVGWIASAELEEATGNGGVAMRTSAFGQALLAVGDEVSFCVPPLDRGEDYMRREAQMVVLEHTARPIGAVLGRCMIRLPRPTINGRRQDLSLQCHAFADKVILSDVALDASEAELSRFFSKQGALDTIVAHANSRGFASVAFPTTGAVSRLLVRRLHAFADDRETQVAEVLPLPPMPKPEIEPSLPAMPAPVLSAGSDRGQLIITWSPVVLASEYLVQLRPAGMQADWASVDDSTDRLKDVRCSSIRVAGLPSNTVFESRVSYLTSCGSRSEPSACSEWCTPHQPPAQSLPPACHYAGGVNMAATMPHAQAKETQMMMMMAQQTFMHPPTINAPASCGGQYGFSAPMQQAQYLQAAPPPAPTYTGTASWRCPHGAVIPPPPAPELQPMMDEAGLAINMQWPSVAHAAYYVVELCEAGSSRAECFIRSAAAASPGALVDLRVSGLRPGASCYTAQVCCVAPCGCKSAPSAAGVSPLLPLLPAKQPSDMMFAAIPANPTTMAATLPFTAPTILTGGVAGGHAVPPPLSLAPPSSAGGGGMTAPAPATVMPLLPAPTQQPSVPVPPVCATSPCEPLSPKLVEAEHERVCKEQEQASKARGMDKFAGPFAASEGEVAAPTNELPRLLRSQGAPPVPPPAGPPPQRSSALKQDSRELIANPGFLVLD